jgi:hypothetical protein
MPKYELNRRLFIAWAAGTLLTRDQRGKCLILDGSDFSRRCDAAVAALDRGAVLYLTDESGRRITQMRQDRVERTL